MKTIEPIKIIVILGAIMLGLTALTMFYTTGGKSNLATAKKISTLAFSQPNFTAYKTNHNIIKGLTGNGIYNRDLDFLDKRPFDEMFNSTVNVEHIEAMEEKNLLSSVVVVRLNLKLTGNYLEGFLDENVDEDFAGDGSGDSWKEQESIMHRTVTQVYTWKFGELKSIRTY